MRVVIRMPSNSRKPRKKSRKLKKREFLAQRKRLATMANKKVRSRRRQSAQTLDLECADSRPRLRNFKPSRGRCCSTTGRAVRIHGGNFSRGGRWLRFRRAAMQIGRVHERVKFAIREQFHGIILTANHAKDTKEFSRRTIPALFMGEIFAAKRSPEFSSSVRRDMVAVRLDYAAPEQSFFN